MQVKTLLEVVLVVVAVPMQKRYSQLHQGRASMLLLGLAELVSQEIMEIWVVLQQLQDIVL